MSKADIKHLDEMIEIVAHSIPREKETGDLFRNASEDAKCTMAKVLFKSMSAQEEQHEAKLRATLEILQQELDEAKGKPLGADIEAVCASTDDDGLTDPEKVKDLEKCMEIVIRMIPKEQKASQLYQKAAKKSKRDLTSSLFEWLAQQESQHESKLRGILNLLRMELQDVRLRRK